MSFPVTGSLYSSRPVAASALATPAAPTSTPTASGNAGQPGNPMSSLYDMTGGSPSGDISSTLTQILGLVMSMMQAFSGGSAGTGSGGASTPSATPYGGSSTPTGSATPYSPSGSADAAAAGIPTPTGSETPSATPYPSPTGSGGGGGGGCQGGGHRGSKRHHGGGGYGGGGGNYGGGAPTPSGGGNYGGGAPTPSGGSQQPSPTGGGYSQPSPAGDNSQQSNSYGGGNQQPTASGGYGGGNQQPTPSGGYGGTPQGTPTPGGAATPTGGSTATTGAVNGGGPKQLLLKNNDTKPMKVGLFENTGPGMNPEIDNPQHVYTIQPGQQVSLSMPSSWQGRAQKLTGNASDPATWAELNFENKNGVDKTWYDESLIRGYNGALTISDGNGGNVAGTNKTILNGAPAGAVKTDSGGNKVIDATEGYNGQVNTAAEGYFNQAVGPQNAYVRHDDNGAVRTSDSNTLKVDFYGT